MGKFFLPIVFENILPPFSMMNFYLLAWLCSVFIFYPRFLLSKSLLQVYLFMLFYTLMIIAGFYSIVFENVLNEMRPLFFAFIMLQYFLLTEDFEGLALLLKASIVFITITLISSIIGLQKFPLASRELGGGLARKDEFELIRFYRSIGIAGYDFFYGLAFSIPVLTTFLKKSSLKTFQKIAFLFIIILAFFGIIKAQFTTAFLFAAIGTGLSYWSRGRVKSTLIRLVLLITIVIVIPEHVFGDAIYFISKYVEGRILKERLVDLSITLSEGIGEEDTHIDRRAQRIPYLLNQFFASPIFGGGESLGHNYWFDRLSMFGLVGIIPWFFIIKYQIKRNLKIFNDEDRLYYLLVMILYLSMGLIKNMGHILVQIMIFFIIPAALIIKGRLVQVPSETNKLGRSLVVLDN